MLVRVGYRALRLDVQLLLQPHAERALDHHVRPAQRGLRVPLHDLDRGVGLVRVRDVQYRVARLVVDVHAARRLLERGPVGRGKEQDRLFLVADLALRKRRLVVADQLDHVVAGDVRGRHHHHAGPVEGGVEGDGPVAGRVPEYADSARE